MILQPALEMPTIKQAFSLRAGYVVVRFSISKKQAAIFIEAINVSNYECSIQNTLDQHQDISAKWLQKIYFCNSNCGEG